ncbi:MAG: hypothetical protein LBI18_03960 [Planctomycetaceae bacterium]|jgi:hypothetical protein|nr:hypothetical protein [Planctomycetaceae bacterium]
MNIRLFIYCAFILTLLTGCTQPPPPGLPPVVPCTVRVVDQNKPLPAIDVSFLCTEGQGAWTLNGKTNSSGNAVARTIVGSYHKNGLPIGTYRVTLGERIDIPLEFTENAPRDPKKSQEFFEKQKKYIAEHRTLPEIFYDSKTTPIELVVQEPGVELTIDVSAYRNGKSK